MVEHNVVIRQWCNQRSSILFYTKPNTYSWVKYNLCMKNLHDLNKLTEEIKQSDGYWTSFLEKSDFELGVLYLEPDQEDIQTPHKSDEIYFIIEGDGYMKIGDEAYEIKPHTALYVPQNTNHKIYGNSIPIIAYYALN